MTSCPDVGSAGARLPNLFVVGAMRAGTTTLCDALAAHPEAYMSPVKEPHYFARADGPAWMDGISGEELARYLRGPMPPRHNALVADWDDYLALFEGAGCASVVGEASPSYLYSERAPAEIISRCPGAVGVLCLRRPLARALSHHRMEVAVGTTAQGFPEALGDVDPAHPYVDGGLYADRVERYLRTFGRERVRVYLFEQLVADSGEVLDDLARALGIDPSGFGAARSANIGRSPRMPRLNAFFRRTGAKDAIRRVLPSAVLRAGKRLYYSTGGTEELPAPLVGTLEEIFRPDIRRLETLLDRDLSHWLEDPLVDPVSS